MQEKNSRPANNKIPPRKRATTWSLLFRAVVIITLLTSAFPFTGISHFTSIVQAQKSDSGIMSIEIIDTKNSPVANATVTVLNAAGQEVGQKRTTNEKGIVQIPNLPVGEYTLKIDADKFITLNEPGIKVVASAMTNVQLQLTEQVAGGEIVEVQSEDKGNLIETVRQPEGQLTQQVLKTVPLQSQDFTAALPLIPNVIRPTDGKVSIKGAREDQSSLLINNADATDPATGIFSLGIPLESIDKVKVFTNPYLPEYGKFTGGVVKVETKPGGDKFKFEVDDFFPEPRFRGGKLFGFANVSPRIHLEGPFIKNKFYFSQGFEFGIDKKPVRGLPSPDNEIIKKDIRSFTQFDYIISPKQTFTVTANYSFRETDHIGLDFFNPQTVAPNQKVNDFALSATDRYTTENGSFIEALVQYKRIASKVFGEGSDLMQISPLGRSGNFFHAEERITDRYQVALSDALPAITKMGIHNVKIGVDINYLSNTGSNRNQTVQLTRTDGTIAQEIKYFTAGSINASNAQVAAYAQDQWLIRRNLSFDYGLRVEAQRTTAGISVMPRAAIAYSPGSSGKSVFKAAVGLFYDKVPLNAVSFENQPQPVITTFGPDGSIIDGPRLFRLDIAPRPNGRLNNGTGFAAPRNTTFNLEFDQKLTPRALLRIAYLDSRTRNDLYVSPIVSPTDSVIMLFNNGRGRYRSLEVTTSFDLPASNSLSLTYVKSRAKGELNDYNSFFGDFPDPVIRPNEFGRLPTDAPNRFLARGNFKLPYQFSIVPLLEYRTGFPYSIKDELQNFVGERNTARFPRFFSLDMAFSKDIRIKDKYTAQFTFSLFNVTDHFNPRNVRANIADPNFGTFFASYRRFYRVDFSFEW